MKQKRIFTTSFIILTILSLFLLGGCQKKAKEPEEVVDEYLKKIQQKPYTITDSISSMNREYREQIEDLIKEFEYEIHETRDTENGEKCVLVTFTGYNIGAYFCQYLENYQTDVQQLLEQDHTWAELEAMRMKKPEEYKELFKTADLEVFTKYMNECREAGKTHHTEKGKSGVFVWKSEKTKEWEINLLGSGYYLDWITNGVYTDFQNYKKSVSED
ncbi:MAG: hypothetical protein IJG49_09145 [Erysipelotrichaceae bacterium]|nr:hypothetical protein [Erysipelotrichaceae bacterium]